MAAPASPRASAAVPAEDGWTRTMRYIIGRKQVEQALGFLSHVGAVLERPSPEPEGSYCQVAGAALRFRADWSFIAIDDPEGIKTISECAGPALPEPTRSALKDFVSGLSRVDSSPMTPPPGLADLGVHSIIGRALSVQGTEVGRVFIALASRPGRPARTYTVSDAAVATDLARRLSQALLVDRLYRRIGQSSATGPSSTPKIDQEEKSNVGSRSLQQQGRQR
jgi:hypothetical protein